MEKQCTNDELRRALLNVIGAINELPELVESVTARRRLRAAVDILVPHDDEPSAG